MATYAAYRHVELDKVGCGKRSIMKPPGGDCHDIFGADFHGTPAHHRVLKPPGGGTSDLFSPSSEEATKPRATPGTENTTSSTHILNGSEGKVNGVNGKSGNETDSTVSSESQTQVQESKASSESSSSSNLTSEIANLNAQDEKRARDKRALMRNCVTGEGCQTTDHYVIRVHRQRDGNPVTGEGYDTPEMPTPAPQRARIPPGGYSSGLW